MSKEAKTVVGLVVVAVLVLGAFLTMGMLVAFGVLIAGGLAVAALMQRSDAGPAPLRSRPRRNETTDLLHSATSTIEPLTTWTPPDALKPWSPPTDPEAGPAPAPPTDPAVPRDFATDFAPAPPDAEAPPDFWSTTAPSVADFSDLAEPGTTDQPSSWLDDPFRTGQTAPSETAPSETAPDETTWADGSTWDGSKIAADSNPLDDLARLDDIDVIAEFERLDERETPARPGFDSLPPLDALLPINEAVSSADDIMAASQATELQVEEDDNSELAKLLAKVQARLAAYE